MPQRIEIPGEGVLEFPDGMTDDQIASAIYSNFPNLKSQPQQDTFDPSAGGGTLNFAGFDTGVPIPESINRGLAGAGKAFVDTGRGIGQLLGLVSQESIDESKRLDQPLMNTTAGLLGNIGGNVVSLAVPGGGLKVASKLPGLSSLNTAGTALLAPKTVTGAGLLGAGIGATGPVASDESRLTNTLLGAAAGSGGQAIGKGIAKAIQPVESTISPTQRGVAETAEKLGVTITPGTRTGSATLRALEAGMESAPFTAGKMHAIKDQNQVVLNRAAARSIGEDSDRINESVLAQAKQRIGSVFNSVEKENIQLGYDFVTRIAKIDSGFQNVWGGRGNSKFNQVIEDALEDAVNGSISGERYNKIRSELSKIASDSFRSGDSRLGRGVDQIIEAIDDAAIKSLPADKASALAQARDQWKHLSTIKRVLNGENVSGPKLANALKKEDPNGFLFGGNNSELYNLARFSDRFRNLVGDSGTATRLGYQALATGLGGGAISGIAGGDPTAGFAVGLGLPLGTRVLQNAYLSTPVQKYLASGLLDSLPQTVRDVGRSGSTLVPTFGLLGVQGSQ